MAGALTTRPRRTAPVACASAGSRLGGREVLERSMGERDPAWLQPAGVSHFFARRRESNVTPLKEKPVSVGPERFAFRKAPSFQATLKSRSFLNRLFLASRLLRSKTGGAASKPGLTTVCNGVRSVWKLDSQTQQAFLAAPAEGRREVKDGVLRTQIPPLKPR